MLPVTDQNLTSDTFFSHYYDDHSSDFNFHEHKKNPSTTPRHVCSVVVLEGQSFQWPYFSYLSNLLFVFLR